MDRSRIKRIAEGEQEGQTNRGRVSSVHFTWFCNLFLTPRLHSNDKCSDVCSAVAAAAVGIIHRKLAILLLLPLAAFTLQIGNLHIFGIRNANAKAAY